jgi:hypothetical protein
MPLVMRTGADASGNEPSPAIWNRLSWSDIHHGKVKYFYDDFTSLAIPLAVASNAAVYTSDKGWYSYQDTGDVITQLATDDNGVLSAAIAATNNNETWLMPGSATSVMFVPKTKANGGQTILFEARVKMSQVTSGNMIVGLSEEGLAAANTISDADAIADKDLIGFAVLEADPDGLTFVYNKASAGGVTTAISAANAANMSADTFVKLGFIVDMEEGNANRRVKAFINGVELGTAVTNTAYENTTTFPTGEEMHVLWGGKNQNAAKTLAIDWVRVAQYKSGN